MNLNRTEPRKALNKAFLKVKTNRSDINFFKTNLINLLDNIKEDESEEFNKNLVSKFLSETYYSPGHFINTKGRNDLVLHNGNTAASTVGVIIEAKSPTNKAEMVTAKNINAKAFQELVLYYLRERITYKNIELKYLIVTNIYEWFIFDASLFEKEFAQNKNLVNQFAAFDEGRLSGKTTDFFYKHIAEPAINDIKHEITFTHFDIREYEKPIRNNDSKDDNALIALYKLLSPEHLLKLPFANDSNSLDKSFYTELLHIIGLAEIKEGSKKFIQRKKEGERNAASLIESAIFQLDNLDKISRLPKPSAFGDTNVERLFNVALELSITWINRILFLKLLEAQLIKYHKGDKSYAFLNSTKVQNFDDLNNLFFSVLARKPSDRNAEVKAHFANVPYLNSSLFEPTEIEHACLFISQLKDVKLPLLPSTVIKDNGGQKSTGELLTIEYIFEFLNAYDFASEGSEEIQEDNKRLINASVLGLIFEKINGYKDGSFFTPGFITMYMCRETIRRAVVQKFNETKNWNCTDINDLYDKIDDRNEANNIVNSLKICDPAVGSGHFLVSALNEIIAIKSDLKILTDRTGKRLKEYVVEVENDELIVTDDDGELFEYNPNSKESQRIQETLFHEKQTIIENCLFGVDLNPNSVKICRLRLWIELLKNAYYKAPDYTELETLPNIDINIKCGNSLISRYALDADIRKMLRNSKWTVDTYRLAVDSYRNAKSKDEKHEMEALILKIKQDFTTEIRRNDPLLTRIDKLGNELYNKFTGNFLFEPEGSYSKKELETEKKRKIQQKKIEDEINALTKKIEEIKNNRIYENAFEWRFEFPEVLNNDGVFIGFDVIIENPPYVFARENFDTTSKKYFADNYPTSQYQVNLFFLFIEKTISILKNKGQFSLIVPNSLLMVSSAQSLRKHLLNETSLSEVINLMGYTFEGVNVETIIFSGNKTKPIEENYINIYSNKGQAFILNQTKAQSNFKMNEGFELNVFSDKESDEIIKKLNTDSEILDNLVQIKAGLKAYESGKGNPKQSTDDVKKRIYDYNYKFDNNTYEYLEGKDVVRYSLKWSGTYLRYGDHLAAPRTFDIFNGRKIIIREITGKYPQSIIATYSEDIYLFNMSNIAIVEKDNANISLKYVLALLNSKLMSYYFMKNTAKSVRQMFPKIILEDLRKFPIKNISISDQQPFITLVDKILLLKRENIQADTSYLESEIDQLVYQLYELTDEEIKIVEML